MRLRVAGTALRTKNLHEKEARLRGRASFYLPRKTFFVAALLRPRSFSAAILGIYVNKRGIGLQIAVALSTVVVGLNGDASHMAQPATRINGLSGSRLTIPLEAQWHTKRLTSNSTNTRRTLPTLSNST